MALLGGLLSAATGVPARYALMRETYEASASNCVHGQRGHIVHLHDTSPHPHEYFNIMQLNAHPEDVMHHHYNQTFRGVAARLHSSSLERVLLDEHVHAVEADCIYYMPKHLDQKHLGPRPLFPKATTLAAHGEAGGVSMQEQEPQQPAPGESMLKAGVEYRSKVSPTGRHWNWGMDRVDGKEDDEYDFGHATGKGAVLYTIDTGVYIDHEEFEQKLKHRIIGGWSVGCPTGKEAECGTRWLHQGHLTQKILQTSSFKSMNGEVCEGHGTHTASTAAGKLYGVAKEAEIVVVQGLDCNGTASDSMFIAALDWAVSHAKTHGKPSVMSMSLGGKANRALNKAAQNAIEAGYSVVAASGNSGEDSCRMSPGAQPGTISVAASDDDDALASYSNHGKCTTLIAPGSSIVAAWTSGTTDATSMSGTSMATPHAAGAVLQVLGKFPHYKPEEVRRALACMAQNNIVHGNGMMEEYGGTPNRLLRTGVSLDMAESLQLIRAQHMNSKSVSAESMTHEVRCHKEDDEEDSDATVHKEGTSAVRTGAVHMQGTRDQPNVLMPSVLAKVL